MENNLKPEEDNKVAVDLSAEYNAMPNNQWKQFLSELMLNIMHWYLAKVKQEQEALDKKEAESLPTKEDENV